MFELKIIDYEGKAFTELDNDWGKERLLSKLLDEINLNINHNHNQVNDEEGVNKDSIGDVKDATQSLKELLLEDKVDEVFSNLREKRVDQNTLLLLESRYNAIKKDWSKKTISRESYTTEMNQIKDGLLPLIEDANIMPELGM